MLVVGGDANDRALVDDLNEWLAGKHPQEKLVLTSGIDSAWGGYKWPEVAIYATALNHADLEALVAKIASLPWQRPHLVQLLIQDQWESTFGLWMFDDERRLREIVAPRTYSGSQREPFNAAWRTSHRDP
jgi:hypothetical protein